MGVPLVMGLVCSSITTAGYGMIRIASLFGIVFSYVMMRNPEVQR
jgi:hypothetical protein